jgi:hypothetical protein
MPSGFPFPIPSGLPTGSGSSGFPGFPGLGGSGDYEKREEAHRRRDNPFGDSSGWPWPWPKPSGGFPSWPKPTGPPSFPPGGHGGTPTGGFPGFPSITPTPTPSSTPTPSATPYGFPFRG